MNMFNEKESKAWRKLSRKEIKFEREQRFLRKISEEYEALEEVFDKSTLMTLYKMLNDGIIESVSGVISAGKEARVYYGEDPQGGKLAIKIYLTMTSEFRRGRLKYIIGDPRFPSNLSDMRKIVNIWASKEYKNLKRAYEAGVNVPKPVFWRKNIVVMEFIGEDSNPAPTLKDLSEVNEEIYDEVLNQIRKLYRDAGLIHADLSEYNMFYFNERVILFDFAQAVVKEHPMAEEFLIRDISNVNYFFRRKGVMILDLESALSFVKE